MNRLNFVLIPALAALLVVGCSVASTERAGHSHSSAKQLNAIVVDFADGTTKAE